MSKPTRHKPQPLWAQFKQPPKGPRHGKHRRTTPPSHGSAPQRTSPSDDGADALRLTFDPSINTAVTRVRTSLPPTTWRTINPSVGAHIALSAYTAQVLATFIRSTRRDPAKPIPHAGILPGEITAHRCWLVGLCEEPFLYSITADYRWQPGEVVTGDINGSYGVTPTGIYCYKTLALALVEASNEHAYRMRNYFETEESYLGIAIGTISIWGEVVEHEHGYRASFARVKSLDRFIPIDALTPSPSHYLDLLKRKYLP